MRHRQHGRDARGGKTRGNAAHRAVGLAVFLFLLAADGGGLAGGEDDERDFVSMQVGPEFVGGDEVGLAVGSLEEEVAHVGRAIGIMGRLGLLVAKDLFRVTDTVSAGLFKSFGQSAFAVEDTVAVKVENVHGPFGGVVEPIVQRIERRRPEKFAGDVARRMLLNGIEHWSGISTRIEEPGVLGPADDEEEMNGILRDRRVGLTPAAGAGDPAADANTGLLVK